MAFQQFNFDLNYIRGKEAIITDTLSQAYLPNNTPEIHKEDIEAYIHLAMKTFPMSDNKLEEYKEAITTDPDLQLLKAYTKNAWPKYKNIIITETLHFNS